jgi:hypothetical protein
MSCSTSIALSLSPHKSSFDTHTPIIMVSRLLSQICLLVLLIDSDAFAPAIIVSRDGKPTFSHDPFSTTTDSNNRFRDSLRTTKLYAKSSSQTSYASSLLTPAQEFAFQELRAQLDPQGVLENRKLLPTTLAVSQRKELFQYAQTLAKTNNNYNEIKLSQQNDLIGSSWVLCACAYQDDALSTDEYASLPKGSTLQITFDTADKLQYSLVFPGGAAGLERITAVCDYEWNSSSNRRDGEDTILSMIYKNISFDAFGFLKRVPIGLFGLLQGRGNCIATKHLDESLWIEQGISDTSGRVYYNVYARLPAGK